MPSIGDYDLDENKRVFSNTTHRPPVTRDNQMDQVKILCCSQL